MNKNDRSLDQIGVIAQSPVLYNYTPVARILVQVTIYHRLRIGRDGHLEQSEVYDIS